MDEMEDTQETGDCFPVAHDLLWGREGVRLAVEEDDATHLWVVHGLPRRRGPEGDGRRFWHAWVEVERRVEVPEEVVRAHPEFAALGDVIVVSTVIDRSNGLDLTIPRAAYYALGDLDRRGRDEPPLTWRFTPNEVLAEVARRGHYGPWVDGWEELGR